MLYAKAVMEVVFSAHAEVVPAGGRSSVTAGGILRARGGSSAAHPEDEEYTMYSPRTRR